MVLAFCNGKIISYNSGLVYWGPGRAEGLFEPMLLLLRSLFCYMKPMLLLFRSTFFYMKPIVLRGLNCTHPNYKSCSFQLQGMLLTRLFFTASLFALSIYSQF